MEGLKIRQGNLWCVNARFVQQMSPDDARRLSMSWLLSVRALFSVRYSCISFQRCFVNLCCSSSLFSCLLFQQLCHLFNKDNRLLYPDDCTRLLYSSFGFFCFWLLACTASCVLQCSEGLTFLPTNKIGYRCPRVALWGQCVFLNGVWKIHVFWDVTSCRWISISWRFGGSHTLMVEQSKLWNAWPRGQVCKLLKRTLYD